MKLQLALDLVSIPEGIALVREVQEYIDIVEIGTPVIIDEGLHAVRAMKAAFPSLKVLADLKVMDAGGYEVMRAAEAGADVVTVLGVAEDATIRGAVREAHDRGREILVDMIGVKDLATRAQQVDDMGVDYICVHTGYDLQAEGRRPFDDLRTLKQVVRKAKIAVAGGIKLENMTEILAVRPDVVIVGGGITNAENKLETARRMKELVQQP